LFAEFNPIEEFFVELKAQIKKAWSAYEENPDQGFQAFLRRCVQHMVRKGKVLKAISDMRV
jgi:hypothetical protein